MNINDAEVRELLQKFIDERVNELIEHKVSKIKQTYEERVRELEEMMEQGEKLARRVVGRLVDFEGITSVKDFEQKYNLLGDEIKEGTILKLHDYDFHKYRVKSRLSEILENWDIVDTKIINKADISRSTFYNIKNSNNEISLSNAYKICKVLNMSIEEVFPFVDDSVEENNE